MKKYNGMMLGIWFFFVAAGVTVFGWFQRSEIQENLQYKVEINEIMVGLEKEEAFSKPDLHGMEYIEAVSFLAYEEAQDMQAVEAFYQNKNGVNTTVLPFLMKGGELIGYIRFDYTIHSNRQSVLWITEGILAVACGFLIGVLCYIKSKILKPFHALQNMPYELSKGHLQGELEESKSRFFGKFIWGIAMLRDTLHDAKAREWKLEKEKKLMLLSISHDIKIPLSTIKLYAKALYEGVYDTEEKKLHAAKQIENHALEIEGFVKEIITTSSEDIVSIEVENGEFYLEDFIEKVRQYYEPKCRLVMMKLQVGAYDNRLIKGDMERALEAMENVIENAFKYGDGKSITIDFYEEDYCQIVRVFNTGVPIKSEEMPHVFDSFYRGSNVNQKEGNGLGLYISRQIMRRMDGDMFAVCEEDGMSFHLVFGMA